MNPPSRYRGPYWPKETPQEPDAGRVRFRLSAKAGRLQVVQLRRDPNGNLRPLKAVTVRLEALPESKPARKLLRQVLGDA